jgi:hypothetical protein
MLLAAFALLASVLSASRGWAQSTTPASVAASIPAASIHGLVTSNDNAVYEGARVELSRNADAQPLAVQQTDAEGAFHFDNVAPGPFRIVVSADGFQSQVVVGILTPGQALEAGTVVLPMAGAATEIRVSAQSQVELAQEQLNIEEKQRVLGVFPNYYVSYDHNAVPLTTRQKYQLAWKTNIDPVTLLMAGATAGFEQADNTFAGYGQGTEGYAKRFGANYADGFIGTTLGGAILPSWFHQDPRYFYKGTGSIMSRAGYAIANAVICKGDNGHWQPSYSGIIGGLAAGGISNLYYPKSDRSGVEVSFANAAIGTAEGALQNLVQEFIVRKFTPRLPSFPSVGVP